MITESLGLPSSGEVKKSSKSRLWTGRVLWALTVPFMLFDISLHIANPPFVAEASKAIGLSPSVIPVLGVVELLCLTLYLIPRTAVLGAVLLTGFFGGAVATHVITGTPFVFAILMAVLFWGSLYCRDDRVKSLVS